MTTWWRLIRWLRKVRLHAHDSIGTDPPDGDDRPCDNFVPVPEWMKGDDTPPCDPCVTCGFPCNTHDLGDD